MAVVEPLTVSTILIDLPIAVIVDAVAADLWGRRPSSRIAHQRSILTHSHTRPPTGANPHLARFADARNVFVDLTVAIVINAVAYFRRRATYAVSLVGLSIAVVVESVGADLVAWRDLLLTNGKRPGCASPGSGVAHSNSFGPRRAGVKGLRSDSL